MILIGISGRKGSGKTTLADGFAAQNQGDVTRLSFAEPLKEALKHLFMFSDAQLFGCDKERIDLRWGVSPRWAMQQLATDFLRDQVDQAFFLKHMQLRLQEKLQNFVLIDDIRFQNEQKFIKKHGGLLVHVEREGRSNDEHSSENGLDMSLVDRFIKNNSDRRSTVQQLQKAIKETRSAV
jgi:ABC-type dipeptide/oligopeptide/nickel transport system ATPase subunit